ncbi:hypothetical protein GX865_02580 [Candidatus Saccharibacteria bacterium]|jgi:hypothetical protein|nr:hypothetical protein [Candidatus Saccharibacteria bacterium]
MNRREAPPYCSVDDYKWIGEMSTKGLDRPGFRFLKRLEGSQVDGADDLPWWQKIDSKHIREDLESTGMYRQKPTEQYIIGRDGIGVRFYNYGDRLSASHVAEMRSYVDITSQWLGKEQAQQLVSDVILTPIKKTQTQDGLVTVAFQRDELPGVVFVDSDQLSDHEHGTLRHALLHELAHKIHGPLELDAIRRKKLVDFAMSAGWDEGSLKSEEWAKSYEDGIYMAVQPGSLLSEYGATHPLEAFADVSVSVMEENSSTSYDALGAKWLQFMYDEDKYALAADYPRATLVQDRRTGRDILYPKSTRQMGRLATMFSRFVNSFT